MQARTVFSETTRAAHTLVNSMCCDDKPFILLLDELPVQLRALEPSNPTTPRLLRRLLESQSGADRREIVASVVRELGFDRLTYCRINIFSSTPNPTAMCVCVGDSDWSRRYCEQRYLRVDPRLQRALGSLLPSCWNLESLQRLAGPGCENQSTRAFLNVMDDAGLRSGIMFAMRGLGPGERSVVSLSSSEAATAGSGDEFIAKVLMLSTCLHELYSSYSRWPQQQAMLQSRLGATQVRILRGLARGFTDREIAEDLELSKHGVDYHLRRLRKGFNARNRVELVQAALRAGSL